MTAGCTLRTKRLTRAQGGSRIEDCTPSHLSHRSIVKTVRLDGVVPALATPFAEQGSVDKAQLRDLVDLLLADGVSGFVVSGSTGEYYSMSPSSTSIYSKPCLTVSPGAPS